MFAHFMKGNLKSDIDPTIAIILEIVGAVLGLFGLGSLYAGDNDTGIIAYIAK